MVRGARVKASTIPLDERRLAERVPRPADKSSPDDTLNRSIITLLERDGRRAYSEIAQELGVSEGTIRNRVAGMKQAGMLRIVAIADPVVAEYKSDAMLGIKIAPGHTPHDVAERLGRHTDVVYILWVSGRFDLLVEVVSDDRDGFLKFLDKEVHGQSDIAGCETMTGLKNFKNQFLLKRDWEGDDAVAE